MTPDRLPGAERPEPKPINRLVVTAEDKLPEHFKANHVDGGRVVEDTDKGRVEVRIVALPPKDGRSALGKFWGRVKARLGGPQQAGETELTPTPVAARPQLYADKFTTGQHVQLMGHMPYVVLEDGTRYGIVVDVPAGLQGEWERFEAPASDGVFTFSNRIEIGQRKRGLAVVVRTDDGQPLIRQDLGTTTLRSFQEMLSGGFKQSGADPSREQLMIKHRTTVQRTPSLGVGEEKESQSTQEALLFSALGSNEGVGTVDDKKGRIEVIVYEVVEKQVSEIVETPLPGLLDTRSRFDDTLGGGMKSFGGGVRGGFSAGETSFGKETRRKVNVQGVVVEKPLAAFQVVLVGELPEQEIEMVINEG